MADYDLYYWSIPFRGQFVRAVLAYAGKSWTEGGDAAISQLMKEPAQRMPVPFMGPPLPIDNSTGFAIAQNENGFPKRLLKGRSARIVVTMGMPARFYSLFYRAHSIKSLERNILGFASISPVRHSIIGSVESGSSHREGWLKRMRELGAQGR